MATEGGKRPVAMETRSNCMSKIVATLQYCFRAGVEVSEDSFNWLDSQTDTYIKYQISACNLFNSHSKIAWRTAVLSLKMWADREDRQKHKRGFCPSLYNSYQLVSLHAQPLLGPIHLWDLVETLKTFTDNVFSLCTLDYKSGFLHKWTHVHPLCNKWIAHMYTVRNMQLWHTHCAAWTRSSRGVRYLINWNNNL